MNERSLGDVVQGQVNRPSDAQFGAFDKNAFLLEIDEVGGASPARAQAPQPQGGNDPSILSWTNSGSIDQQGKQQYPQLDPQQPQQHPQQSQLNQQQQFGQVDLNTQPFQQPAQQQQQPIQQQQQPQQNQNAALLNEIAGMLNSVQPQQNNMGIDSYMQPTQQFGQQQQPQPQYQPGPYQPQQPQYTIPPPPVGFQQPQLPVNQRFIEGDEVTTDNINGALNKLAQVMNQRVATNAPNTQQIVQDVIKSIMPAVGKYTQDTVNLNLAAQRFYNDNKDLYNHRQFVQWKANQLHSQNPGIPLDKLLTQVATEVRQTLGLQDPNAPQGPRAADLTPNPTGQQFSQQQPQGQTPDQGQVGPYYPNRSGAPQNPAFPTATQTRVPQQQQQQSQGSQLQQELDELNPRRNMNYI